MMSAPSESAHSAPIAQYTISMGFSLLSSSVRPRMALQPGAAPM